MGLKLISLSTFLTLKHIPLPTNKPLFGRLCKRYNASVSQPFMIPETPVKKFITHWMQQYEDFIGITTVKHAQNKVIMAEKKFQETQETRREVQREIQELQNKLKEIHRELDKTSRGEDRYLHLITQEHKIIKDEKTMMDQFRLIEKDERDFFSALSLAVHESHEQERTQAEKTKYWSVIGSILGAVIGIVGTTISNRMRMKELRQLVTDASQIENSTLLAEQQTKLESFLTDIKQMLMKMKDDLENDKTNENRVIGNEEVEAMEKRLAQEMREVKALITAQLIPGSRPLNDDEVNKLTPVNVYFGEDLGKMVLKAEQNLEWKMKINSLATVAAFYGVFAVTVPIIFHLFKGN